MCASRVNYTKKLLIDLFGRSKADKGNLTINPFLNDTKQKYTFLATFLSGCHFWLFEFSFSKKLPKKYSKKFEKKFKTNKISPLSL